MMKKYIVLILVSLFAKNTIADPGKGFVLSGKIPGIKDGIIVSLVKSGAAYGKSEELAVDTVKNGQFILRGIVENPVLCTVVTNNQYQLAKSGEQKTRKIHWTWNDVFIDNVEMTFEAKDYDSITSEPFGEFFKITGGDVQKDYTAYNQLLNLNKEKNKGQSIPQITADSRKQFISTYPHSVVALFFANYMLKGGYSLNDEELQTLNKSIVSVQPNAQILLKDFRENIKNARELASKGKVVPLELFDTNGKTHVLTNAVPKGKYVLVDFWASWCSPCLIALPHVKEVVKRHSNNMLLIGVSQDRAEEAWKKSMVKEGLKGAQYLLTPKGSTDLSKKYLIAGVPYFMLVDPNGAVVYVSGAVGDMVNKIDELLK